MRCLRKWWSLRGLGRAETVHPKAQITGRGQSGSWDTSVPSDLRTQDPRDVNSVQSGVAWTAFPNANLTHATARAHPH